VRPTTSFGDRRAYPRRSAALQDRARRGRSTPQATTQFHYPRSLFLSYLPDPAGSMHHTMNVVADTIRRADSQLVEPGEFAVGGRIGHGIPVRYGVGLLRRQANNKSLTSEYKRHVRSSSFRQPPPKAIRETCRLPLCPALCCAPRQTQIERMRAARVRSKSREFAQQSCGQFTQVQCAPGGILTSSSERYFGPLPTCRASKEKTRGQTRPPLRPSL
jgi:hypothetical protein